MLNWLLGTLAAALWGAAYGWYFQGDVRRWLWRRRNRRRLAEMQRAQAYAAWMRRTAPRRAPQQSSPPPTWPALPAPPASEAPPRPSAAIIPFPRSKGSRPKRG